MKGWRRKPVEVTVDRLAQHYEPGRARVGQRASSRGDGMRKQPKVTIVPGVDHDHELIRGECRICGAALNERIR